MRRLTLFRLLTLFVAYEHLEANYFNSIHLKKPIQKSLNFIQGLSNENVSLVSEIFPMMSETFVRRNTRILSKNLKGSEIVKYEKSSHTDFLGDGRTKFLRSIYLVYCVQMMATIAVTGAIVSVSTVSKIFYAHWAFLWVLSFLSSSILCSLLCLYPQLRHESPNKFLVLGAQNCFQGIMVGAFSTLLQPKLVCLGTVHTVASLLSLALYTYASDKDLTWNTSTSITSVTAAVVGTVLHFFASMPVTDNILSAAMAIALATFIGHDTTGIMNGKHKKYSYGKNEYILVALQMYQDALNMGVDWWRSWRAQHNVLQGNMGGILAVQRMSGSDLQRMSGSDLNSFETPISEQKSEGSFAAAKGTEQPQ